MNAQMNARIHAHLAATVVSLSVTPDNPKIDDGECKESSFWVDNASHHFWTHEILDTDGVEVQDARARIHETVMGWIKEEEELAAGN